MNMLMPGFIELFNHCYPGHQMLLNIDWSSNHSEMAPNARTLGNMRVLSGGMRKKLGDEEGSESMPVFADYVLEKDDMGSNVPRKWKSKVLPGKKMRFHFMKGEKPFYASPNQPASDFEGLPIGKRECAYRLG